MARSPSGQVLADAANLQCDTQLLFDELAHRRPTPEMTVHLELFGALVDDHALHGVFLKLTEHSPIASGASTQRRSEGDPAACLAASNTPIAARTGG